MLKYVTLTVACMMLMPASAHASRWVINPPSSDASDPNAPAQEAFNDSSFQRGNFNFSTDPLDPESHGFGNPARAATYRGRHDPTDFNSSSELHGTTASTASSTNFTGINPFSARADFDATAKTATEVGGDGMNKFGASGEDTPLEVEGTFAGVASMDEDDYISIKEKDPVIQILRDFNY